MLTNHITDTDLKAYYPKLQSQLWSTQTTYETQIDKAFDRLVNDLRGMGINPRLVMTRLDLNNATTDKNLPLQSATMTVPTTGSSFESHNERRFVLTVTAGSGSVYLEGSNQGTPTEDGWSLLDTFMVSDTDEYATVIGSPSKYYRIRVEPSTTITFTAQMVETSFDDAIILGALKLIFADFVKEVGDIWHVRLEETKKDYESVLRGLKFAYDSDMSGAITTGEDDTRVINITLAR